MTRSPKVVSWCACARDVAERVALDGEAPKRRSTRLGNSSRPRNLVALVGCRGEIVGIERCDSDSESRDGGSGSFGVMSWMMGT
jgi:hypothetical protein